MLKVTVSDTYKQYKGEIEFIIKDRLGNILSHHIEPNIVKIYAKEMLSHRIPHSKVWDPTANTGEGAWVASGIDPLEEFSAKYIIFGASFDDNGVPLGTNDSRYYQVDPVTQIPTPIRLEPGADFDGGLINAIPIAEPDRPLKRIEKIDFEGTYQPAGTPLLQEDVRAMNNVLLLETTLLPEEYNGFSLSGTNGDFFTITEVALAGGKELGTIGSCECDPKDLFLEGDENDIALLATANGTDIISLDPSVTLVDLIKEGDSIKITGAGGTIKSEDTLGQVSPYYLVVGKNVGGRDIQLDRVPVDSNNTPLSGQIGVLRNTLRIFSHRILSTPVKKQVELQITVRWRLLFF